MGEAIIRGLLRASALAPSQIIASDVRADVVSTLAQKYGIRPCATSLEAASNSAATLLCVKPFQLPPLLGNEPMQTALLGKLVISIAAGVRIEKLKALLPKSSVVRAMPNTPTVVGEGMTALAQDGNVPENQMTIAVGLFSAVGLAQEVSEAQMDVITAISGSGPAFMFVMIDALADGAVKMGLRRDLAMTFVTQTMKGAARMVAETGIHPSALKDQVTTPGGCTAAGLAVLEAGKIRSVLARTVEETTTVASKLG